MLLRATEDGTVLSSQLAGYDRRSIHRGPRLLHPVVQHNSDQGLARLSQPPRIPGESWNCGINQSKILAAPPYRGTKKNPKKKPAATTLRALSTRGAKTSFAYFTCDILLSADCAASVPPYCEMT